MVVVAQRDSATHPLNCTRLWCSKQPHSTRKIFLEKLKCVAQAHTTGKLTPSKAFAKSKTEAKAPSSSSFASPSNLSIRISHTVCWAPPCLPSSGALTASHQRINVGMSAIGLSLMIFFGIKKNMVVHACCGHFPLCSTFSKNSTVSPNVSCVTFRRTFWAEAIRTFLFLPYTISILFQFAHFQPWQGFLQFLQLLSFFQGFVLHVLHAFVALPMLCPCTSPPCCWLTDLVQEPSASLRNLNHLRHFLLMHFLHLFSSSFFFISSIHLYHFCMVSSHGWIHAFSQSAANKSVTHHRFSALTLHVDLIFFVKSFINFILCCCFISSSLVTPYVCFVNAGGSALSLPILFLYFLFLRTRLHYSGARASASICPPNSSSIDRSLPDSNFSILSFLLCLFQHHCLPCLSFLQ